jgi:hypothetical protein
MGAELAAVRGGVIEARPNPLQVCGLPGVGSVTLHWSFPGRAIDIRVGSPGGKLWSSPAGTGSAATGPWVRDGMAFYVQDREGKVPTSAQSTLGITVVRHTQAGCPSQGLR